MSSAPTVVVPGAPRLVAITLGGVRRVVLPETPTLTVWDVDDATNLRGVRPLTDRRYRRALDELLTAAVPHSVSRGDLIAWALSCPASGDAAFGEIPPRDGFVVGVPINTSILAMALATDTTSTDRNDRLLLGAVPMGAGQALAVHAPRWRLLLAGLSVAKPYMPVFYPEMLS